MHTHIQIDQGHSSTDDVLRDYCDGNSYSKHPLLAKDHSFLQIILYYDDLEVCNPIGSKRIIHKLGRGFISVVKWFYILYYSGILFSTGKYTSQVSLKGKAHSTCGISKE